jgi:excisionase family DNA binding protein
MAVRRRIKKALRARRGMATPTDLCAEIGVSKSVAYQLVESGAVPSARAGRRWLISWETIEKVKRGQITFQMPCRA